MPALSPADHIRNLLYTYADLLDRADLAGLEDLFSHAIVTSDTSDGEWRGRHAPPRDPTTPVLEIFQAAKLESAPGTHHVTTNTILEFGPDGDFAESRSYYTVFQARNKLPFQPVIGGRYRDTFEFVEESWRFRTRHFIVDHVGDLTQLLGGDPRR